MWDTGRKDTRKEEKGVLLEYMSDKVLEQLFVYYGISSGYVKSE